MVQKNCIGMKLGLSLFNIKMLIRTVATFLLCVNCVNMSAFGQEAATSLHCFMVRKGYPLTVGKIVELDKSNIVVIDGNKNRFTVAIRELSKDSQKFVRLERERILRVKKEREKASLLTEQINNGSPSLQKKKIKELGKISFNAGHCSETIYNFTKHFSEPELKLAGFYCFLSICPPNKTMFDAAINLLRNDLELRQMVILDPSVFFDGIVKFGTLAEPILINGAYTGTLNFAPEKDKVPDLPETLSTTSGPKNTIRASASHSLSKIATTKSRNAVMNVLKAAEKQINRKTDRPTILAIINGWSSEGNLNVPNSRVTTYHAIAEKYKNTYTREINAWDRRAQTHAKAMGTLNQLRALSTMRNFFNRNEIFITRGEIVNVDQNKVVIDTYLNQTISVDFQQFSNADQDWISKHWQDN
ncbi:hypothetical protein N9V88_02405 [bacterium]|nr:hypothetical protein [bacterium]